MGKGRLEAFSDGVLAIIITIMVLELKVPHGGTLADLQHLAPVFAGYLVSFVYVAIYWNNHHHLLHGARAVDARIMWANMHLLFWLSLIPFTTGWIAEFYGAPWPTAAYGVNLVLAGFAYRLLELAIVAHDGKDSVIGRATRHSHKGTISLVAYSAAIGLAFLAWQVAIAVYVVVAIMWVIPDRRITKQLPDHPA
ncbi:MAG: TMEM175 family protein [Proteobacteria bacterium]|nr:TMEM175 family protein [Pseudomonadota bacterium]